MNTIFPRCLNWHTFRLTVIAVTCFISLSTGQGTVPETSCTFHDDTSIFNVQLTKASRDCDGGEGNDRLVEEIKVSQQKTSDLANVFVELQSMVLRLMEANTNLSERLRRTEDELRSTKQALQLNNGVSLGCPAGYPVHYEAAGSCYVFVSRDLTWYDAQSFCASTGGHLVAVESNAEHTFLLDHIQTSTDLSGKHFWTGGNDIAKENEWIWTGINQPFNFTQWLEYPHPNNGPVMQPDNHDDEEHCVHMFYLHNYEWNDMYCGYEYFFICEYKLLQN